MEINILNRQNTVLNKFIAEIRDRRIQCDSMRFRRNLERIGELMAYEISKRFRYTPRTVETPLGEAEVELYDNEIVIATILRAGLPFHQGFLNYFDDAQNAFVSAYRKSKKDGTFTVKVEYISCGSLEGKTMLLVDPMLATGSSAALVYEALVEKGGMPAHTHVASIIGSEQGVDYVQRHMPHATTSLWCAAVDDSILIDVGDILQGSALSSYNILQEGGENSPMATALRYIGYDAFVLGNHEFNYAPQIQWNYYNLLTSTDKAVAGQPVDVICSNVVETETNESVFSPYKTFTYKFEDGTTFTIGLLGFENMNNANWDVASHYEGCTFGHPDNTEKSYV